MVSAFATFAGYVRGVAEIRNHSGWTCGYAVWKSSVLAIEVSEDATALTTRTKEQPDV